jgi:hypothetical protein
MTASVREPDEPGTLTSRERAILADIATGLSTDRQLAERMAGGRRPPSIGWVWAGQIALLVVLLAALAGAMFLYPGLTLVEAGMLTAGVIGPWTGWCSVTLSRPRR